MRKLPTFCTMIAVVLCLTMNGVASAQDNVDENRIDKTLIYDTRLTRPIEFDPSLSQEAELSLVPYLTYRMNDPNSTSLNLSSRLGIGFRQITDEALRKQLQLGENEGLVVVSIRDGSAAETAGLQRFAVVRSIDGLSVDSIDDVANVYRNVEEGIGLSWDVVQVGKARTIEIAKPSEKTSTGKYRIGVNIKPADDVLKSQLGIRENTGLVITGIIVDSPAEKAGLKVNDVLTVAGKALLPTTEHLNGVTRTSKEDKVTYKYYRGGKEYTVEISASDQVGDQIRTAVSPEGFLYSPRTIDFTFSGPVYGAVDTRLIGAGSESKLDQLIKKIDSLESQLREIRQELENHK